MVDPDSILDLIVADSCSNSMVYDSGFDSLLADSDSIYELIYLHSYGGRSLMVEPDSDGGGKLWQIPIHSLNRSISIWMVVDPV